MSKKSWPNLYNNLLYKMGKNFSDRQYYLYLLNSLFKVYCMSKKSWPNLYDNFMYKMGQDFSDIQYTLN